MQIKGKVINSSSESREMVDKNSGVKRVSLINHVLLMSDAGKDGSVEVYNIRSFDSSWALPKVGDSWTTPPIKKYENYGGSVAEVLV